MDLCQSIRNAIAASRRVSRKSELIITSFATNGERGLTARHKIAVLFKRDSSRAILQDLTPFLSSPQTKGGEKLTASIIASITIAPSFRLDLEFLRFALRAKLCNMNNIMHNILLR